MGDEQTALLLAEQKVKGIIKSKETNIVRKKNPKKQMFKDTAPRCGGWHNQHRMTTGANRRSELQDF